MPFNEANKKHQVVLMAVALVGLVALTQADSHPNRQAAATCQRELGNANTSLSAWAEQMETMINESKLPAGTVRETIYNEANKVLDAMEEFGQQIHTRLPSQLARDLVAVRRRANRLALDVYLNTFDMRWPQNSLQLNVIVERVQQACLDRKAIQALESPGAPLAGLLYAAAARR